VLSAGGAAIAATYQTLHSICNDPLNQNIRQGKSLIFSCVMQAEVDEEERVLSAGGAAIVATLSKPSISVIKQKDTKQTQKVDSGVQAEVDEEERYSRRVVPPSQLPERKRALLLEENTRLVSELRDELDEVRSGLVMSIIIIIIITITSAIICCSRRTLAS
jgi:hypothetical protein